jgi:hypothetical protein
MSHREHEYAIYKGDTFIDIGTKKELALKFGCKPEYIEHLSTPVHYRRRFKNNESNSMIAVKLGPKLIDKNNNKGSEM